MNDDQHVEEACEGGVVSVMVDGHAVVGKVRRRGGLGEGGVGRVGVEVGEVGVGGEDGAVAGAGGVVVGEGEGLEVDGDGGHVPGSGGGGGMGEWGNGWWIIGQVMRLYQCTGSAIELDRLA